MQHLAVAWRLRLEVPRCGGRQQGGSSQCKPLPCPASAARPRCSVLRGSVLRGAMHTSHATERGYSCTERERESKFRPRCMCSPATPFLPRVCVCACLPAACIACQ